MHIMGKHSNTVSLGEALRQWSLQIKDTLGAGAFFVFYSEASFSGGALVTILDQIKML